MMRKLLRILIFFLFCLTTWFGLNYLTDKWQHNAAAWKNRVQAVEQQDSLSVRPSKGD
jgi:TRAP-type C4-dicarboxylate transport system permease small subunit